MIAAVREQTLFKYGDHVVVQSGFYRGLSGRVTTYLPKGQMVNKSFFGKLEFKPTLIEYHIKTDVGNLDILVDEKQIKLSGNK